MSLDAPRRLTRSVFRDLAIWMVGLGLLTGLVFPPFVLVLGVDRQQALTPRFFAATVAAGLMVGGVNFLLSRLVVGERLRLLSTRMRLAGETIRTATVTGDWASAAADRLRLPVDSEDELGESASAFNRLVDAVEHLHAAEAEARTDDLTGLGNRRQFYLAAEAQLAGAARAALLLVDLDGFKEVNDTLGHHAGDEVLRSFARRLEAALPEAVLLARLGGDEFVALLAGADAAGATAAAERLFAALDEPFALEHGPVALRASVGIALCPEHGLERSTLLRHADEAMYRAKAQGGGAELHDSAVAR